MGESGVWALRISGLVLIWTLCHSSWTQPHELHEFHLCESLIDRSKGMEDARGIMVAAIKSAGKDPFLCPWTNSSAPAPQIDRSDLQDSKPLGLIMVGDKNIGTLNDSEEGNHRSCSGET